MARTVEELHNGKFEDNQTHKPLLKIPLKNVILDELHLFLRVTDVLGRNVILELIQRDI